MIGAINMYLQAYHMYMAQELNKPEVRRLDTMSRDALDTLQKDFPYGVRRLYWCTEKQHSMVHWASNRRRSAGTWAGAAPSPPTSPRAG